MSESAEQPDEDVVRQILEGNTALFELLMRRNNERIYRAARAIVRDELEAENVMQQAYGDAFIHLRQFNGAARFSTCVLTNRDQRIARAGPRPRPHGPAAISSRISPTC